MPNQKNDIKKKVLKELKTLRQEFINQKITLSKLSNDAERRNKLINHVHDLIDYIQKIEKTILKK
jgi:hypothetical protein